MIHDPRTGESEKLLADELFRLVEKDQGRAFISDGIEALSRREIIALAKGSLMHSRKVVLLLEGFIGRFESK